MYVFALIVVLVIIAAYWLAFRHAPVQQSDDNDNFWTAVKPILDEMEQQRNRERGR